MCQHQIVLSLLHPLHQNILEIFIFSLAPGQIGNDKANHVFVTLPLAFTGSHLHTGKITLATLPTFLQIDVYFIHIQCSSELMEISAQKLGLKLLAPQSGALRSNPTRLFFIWIWFLDIQNRFYFIVRLKNSFFICLRRPFLCQFHVAKALQNI